MVLRITAARAILVPATVVEETEATESGKSGMLMGFMKGKVVLLCVVLGVSLGCFRGSVSVGVGNDRTLTGRGVKYIVPWEDGNHTETPRGFEYKGKSLTITEQAGQLTVNGRAFGTVAPGDTVSFTNGVTFVNGQRRDALK